MTAFASQAKRLRTRLRRLMTPARPRRALRAACFALLCPLLALGVLAGCSLAAGASDGAAASESLPQAGEVPEVPSVVGMTRSEAESVLEDGSLVAAPDSTGAMEDLRRVQEELLAMIAAQKQGLQEAQQQMEELQQGAEEQLEELRRQQAEELQLPQDANAVLQLTPFAPLPPDPVEVPDYVGMRVEDIIIMPHFAEIHVRIPGALLLGQNAVRITSQQPAAGTKWDGGPIELKVSGDGPAVTTLALGDVMPDFARFPIGPVFRAEGSGGFGVRLEQPPGPLTTEQSKELWDSGVIIAQKPAAGEVLTKWLMEFSVLVPPAANSASATEEMHILTYSPEYLEDVGGLLPEGGMLLPVPDAEYSTRGFSTSQRGLDLTPRRARPLLPPPRAR